MKVSELRKNIENLRDNKRAEEDKLVSYRNKTNTGVTIAECEARAYANSCNMILAFIEDLVYNQEIQA